MVAEAGWLAEAAIEASAEEGFGEGTEIGEVSITVDDLGEIWFRGKIDRIDVVGEEVRVRDFKTADRDHTSTELEAEGPTGPWPTVARFNCPFM